MDVTLLGIVTDVNALQFANTEAPIDVALLPMMHSFIWEPKRVPIEHPDTIQLLSKIADVKPLQPWKADSPIDVTLLGMVTDAKPLQPEKAYRPIDVTLLGMVTDVKPLQLRKVASSIDVTLLGMTTDVKPLQSSYLQMHLYQSLTC